MILNKLQQSQLNIIIYKLVLGKFAVGDEIVFQQLLKSFENKKVRNLVLACTDLQLICKKKGGFRFFDTFEILIQETVREIFK